MNFCIIDANLDSGNNIKEARFEMTLFTSRKEIACT